MQHQKAEFQPVIVARGCLYVPIDQNAAAISRTIQALIDLLDSMEPDADLEPTLGAPEPQFFQSTYPHASSPVIGSIYPVSSQEHWAEGSDDEREIVCEDEGAQCEDEGADYA